MPSNTIKTAAANGGFSNHPAVAPTIAILVTRRCNMTCAHCSVESAPRVNTPDPSEAELYRIIRESAAAGTRAVQFTGGEPMMRQKLVLALMEEANRHGLANGITTNGFWGKNPRNARTTLKHMLRNNLQYMTISYDRYHAEFMGPQPILNIAAVARDLGFYFNVNLTRTLHDENLDEYARLFGDLPNVRLRLYDVQPIGRARNFDLPGLRAETEGFCNAAAQATFTEDGRMIACNGPAYFDKPESPRNVGNCGTSAIAELLHQHWNDPILDTIRTFGPAGLRDELRQDERFTNAFSRRFAGQCDLCQHISSNPEMVEFLRKQLGDDRHRALRLAKWSLIHNARASGEMTREFVNGPGQASLFYQAITAETFPDNVEKILGRADIDWNHIATYLAGCGAAKNLAGAAAQQQISRWAPPFFTEILQKRAMRDALRELSHAETFDKLDGALSELNIRGILLKGAALYLQEKAHGISPVRIPGDIDLWIENPAAANRLRKLLLEKGFQGEPDAPRTGPHHLAPVVWRSTIVEIHTGVMPSFWGLPEAEMSAGAVPIAGWSSFYTLSAEDMVLHEAIHSTTHLYSFGLKLAVDLFRIERLAVAIKGGGVAAHQSALDWNRIVTRVNAIRCPYAFWVPLVALSRGLQNLLPFPQEALSQAPRTERFRRLTIVAYKRLFTATEDADSMNPFTRNGIFIMLHTGPVSQLRYVLELTRGEAAESRRSHMSGGGRQSWKNLFTHLRHAWFDLRAYRRVVR